MMTLSQTVIVDISHRGGRRGLPFSTRNNESEQGVTIFWIFEIRVRAFRPLLVFAGWRHG